MAPIRMILFFYIITLTFCAQWYPITTRWETTNELVPPNDTVQFTIPVHGDVERASFAAISTGPCNQGNISAYISKNVANIFNFSLTDTKLGAKTRVELTACFVTPNTLRQHGIDPKSKEAQMLEALNFIYENCSGTPSISSDLMDKTEVIYNVSYDMWLSKKFPLDGQAILGQFHGRSDPRIFKAPNGSIIRFSTESAFAICTNTTNETYKKTVLNLRKSKNCKDGVVYDPDGKETGWKYQQGGYPPLTFGYAHNEKSNKTSGWWYVLARSDDRVFTPKGDCGMSPSSSDWPTKQCPGGDHEQVHGLWRARHDALPLGRWISFHWIVRWSRYSSRVLPGELVRNGTILLSIDNAEIINWEGPIGRSDDGRMPFFKIGIYNPSGDTAVMNVSYRNYLMNWAITTDSQ